LIALSVGMASSASAAAAATTAGGVDALAFSDDGLATAIWGGNFLAVGGSHGTFTPPRALLPLAGDGYVEVAAAAAGKQSVLAAEPFIPSNGEYSSTGVYFGSSTSSGRANLTRILAPHTSPISPVLATSPAGDALVGWNAGPRVAVDLRRPQGKLRPPIVAGRFNLQDAAIDGHGSVTVIGYRDPAQIFFASAPRGGRFGTARPLPASPLLARVASGAAGQTAIVSKSSAGVQFLYRPRLGAPFRTSVVIAGSSAQGIVAVDVDSHGRVLAVWTEVEANMRYRLRAMLTDSSGNPTPPFWISPADRDLSYGNAAAAMNANGDAAFVWEQVTPASSAAPAGPPTIYAALRPAAAELGSAQLITPPGRQSAITTPPTVAVAPNGAATLLWSDATDMDGSDRRFMAARLTNGGLTDVTRLDSTAPEPAPLPLTPPLLTALLRVAREQRVSTATGRFALSLACRSWTLQRCVGTVAVVRTDTGREVARKTISVRPNSAAQVPLRLSKTARRTLARRHKLSARVVVTLTGHATSGAKAPITLRPR
jgi:hypothetical protein